MKKITVVIGLFALLIVVACDTSKKGVAAVTSPPISDAPAKLTNPVTTEIQKTAMPAQYEKRKLPTTRLQPMQAGNAPDTTTKH